MPGAAVAVVAAKAVAVGVVPVMQFLMSPAVLPVIKSVLAAAADLALDVLLGLAQVQAAQDLQMVQVAMVAMLVPLAAQQAGAVVVRQVYS